MLLDAFSDGWGGWRFEDVLGAPLMELPSTLVKDLIQLRRLVGIAETVKAKETKNGGSK